MLMALCVQLDVEERLQLTFTNQPEDVITSLIDAATAHINRIAGFTLESTVYTDVDFDPPVGSVLFLPERPLTAVGAVTDNSIALTVDTEYVFYSYGSIVRVSNGIDRKWSTRKRQSITVTYTAGWVTVPEDLVDICANMVMRAFNAGRANASLDTSFGIKQIALQGSDSVTFDTNIGIQSVAATESEMSAIRKYSNEPVPV
ncbi:MAG: hypothetical protein ACYST3_05635 [Planctomycetota bacterium]|jgi:hypothetical protein